ncbi:DUF6471 domain-containing protein [Acetohalobium arabaticum]|uniref:DUF6471 domain-containing protein n=1 Tax=Acetohalobium arabaticum (strain ATCC 49924 / DSM 5501 / Z-7288) TaxID=574087 RepID=D9QQT0_ACEAZ|nr:DUF6471 domain-containing protein [Acetohalobium arabaticum]ADL12871.1 conserved hypothetical protein [Acetohalobium arabaticum DSM 5501]
MLTIKQEIKSYLARTGWTMTDLIKALNEKYNRNDSVQNLSNKLTRGTIKYKEVKEIADIIGAEIIWEF